MGLIAQQVQKVVPELVQKDGEGYLSVDYGRLTPVLVEAIKELKNQVAEKDRQIDGLAARLERLEKAVSRSQADGQGGAP
jgi:hypothetical protein